MMKCITVNEQGTFVFSIVLKDCSGPLIDHYTIIAAKLFCRNIYEKCKWNVQGGMLGFVGVGV